jgi:putative RecB family exonuclease
MSNPVLQQLQSELHISASQIFTYLGCSLKYMFQYVQKSKPQHLSVALPFGKAIHQAIEKYYHSVMDTGVGVPVEAMQELFAESVSLAIDDSSMPILFKKEAPDKDSIIDMGWQLLQVFHANVDLTGYEVVGTEIPLSATLYSDQGEDTDIKLVGIMDLLLKDKANGELMVVDNKTAKNAMAQSATDSDLPMSAYSYLLAANGYVFPRAEVKCRFDVLRKLKKPKMEYSYTFRTADHRKRFAKIASAVLVGIENRIFIPQQSWMCFDCQYKDACNSW